MITQDRLKRIYDKMKARCYVSTSKNYPNYGGRGITICDEWLESFSTFADWAVNNGYCDELSIDRINVNGNYEPSNCRWTDSKIQANNRRHYWLPKNQEDFTYSNAPNSAEITSQREEIKHKLKKYHLTQVWLINQLALRDLQTDKTEMSSLLSGARVGAKSEYILKLSINILNMYEKGMVMSART
jgi:hypothetical protein